MILRIGENGDSIFGVNNNVRQFGEGYGEINFLSKKNYF